MGSWKLFENNVWNIIVEAVVNLNLKAGMNQESSSIIMWDHLLVFSMIEEFQWVIICACLQGLVVRAIENTEMD